MPIRRSNVQEGIPKLVGVVEVHVLIFSLTIVKKLVNPKFVTCGALHDTHYFPIPFISSCFPEPTNKQANNLRCNVACLQSRYRQHNSYYRQIWFHFSNKLTLVPPFKSNHFTLSNSCPQDVEMWNPRSKQREAGREASGHQG